MQLVTLDSDGDFLACLNFVDSAFKVYRSNTMFYFAAERQDDMAKYVYVHNMYANCDVTVNYYSHIRWVKFVSFFCLQIFDTVIC